MYYNREESFFKRFFKIYDDCNIPMMAKGMVYATLTAIIPCLAIILAFLTYLGLPEKLFEVLSLFLETTMGYELGNNLEDYVETYTKNSASLGITGIISFVFTFMYLVDEIWSSLNRIYEGKTTGIHFRYLRYIIFLIIGMLLIASFVYLNDKFDYLLALINDIPIVTGVENLFDKTVPYLVLFCLSLYSYRYFHGAGSCFSSAVLGAILCTVLTRIQSWAFGFLVKSSVHYSVIYGSLASIFLFLMYVSWFWTIFFSCAALAHNIDIAILPAEKIYNSGCID